MFSLIIQAFNLDEIDCSEIVNMLVSSLFNSTFLHDIYKTYKSV